MIEKLELKNAVTQYTFWHDMSDAPLGVMWVRYGIGQNKENIAMLLNIMVANYARRKGIARALLNEILPNVSGIFTLTGSDEGGKEMLENFGFKYNDTVKVWFKSGGK